VPGSDTGVIPILTRLVREVKMRFDEGARIGNISRLKRTAVVNADALGRRRKNEIHPDQLSAAV
jgi:hypothetical protein